MGSGAVVPADIVHDGAAGGCPGRPGLVIGELAVGAENLVMSCGQVVFVNDAADARVSPDTALFKIDRFG